MQLLHLVHLMLPLPWQLFDLDFPHLHPLASCLALSVLTPFTRPL